MATAEPLSLESWLADHDASEVEAHHRAQRRYAMAVLDRPAPRGHRSMPELRECRSCGRGFRPGARWLMAHGERCSDCAAPVEQPVAACDGSLSCAWPRGSCPRHSSGWSRGQVQALIAALGDDDDE